MIAHRQLTGLLILAATALAPASAPAAGGGASPGEIVLPGEPPTVVQIGNPLVSARAQERSIAVRASAIARGRVRIGGTVAAGTIGSVRIERLDARRGWVAVASAAVAPSGTFRAVWRPRRAGGVTLRAVAEAASAEQAPDAAPQVSLTVYAPGVASWYGPGLWGAATACGVTLQPTTIGVAHRTLPCGTPVALYRGGRTLLAPVIDRGPFVAGRTWDLTLATFRALGGGDDQGVLTLGALAQPAAG
jgi:rare lipoprotein A